MQRLLMSSCAALLLCWSAAQSVPAKPGELIDVIAEGTTGPFEIQRLATHLFGSHGPPVIENSVETYRIRFSSKGLDGEPVAIYAQLFVPVMPAPAERPLYVFGSGTTGIADICAPTQERAYPHPLGEYRAYLLAFAGRGFTAIIPDYLGFNDPSRYQSYFNAKAEAQVMLDAVRAVEDFYRRQGAAGADRSVFLGGYSQGGHAAFAAADLRDSYAPELEIAGILGFGATTDVESLLREGPFYAPYIALSYRQDYGIERFDPSRLFEPRWLPLLDEVAGQVCVDQVQIRYPFAGRELYSEEFYMALFGFDLDDEFPRIAEVLEENHTGLSGHGLPALIAQGEDDVIVWTTTQNQFVRQLCESGSKVHYLVYPGVRHRETRPVAFEESIAWMYSLAEGQPPPSSCPLLEERPAGN
ncbi:MAG TPA: alpha/beta fold hydrolase [Trueperaceae bacterium]